MVNIRTKIHVNGWKWDFMEWLLCTCQKCWMSEFSPECDMQTATSRSTCPLHTQLSVMNVKIEQTPVDAALVSTCFRPVTGRIYIFCICSSLKLGKRPSLRLERNQISVWFTLARVDSKSITPSSTSLAAKWTPLNIVLLPVRVVPPHLVCTTHVNRRVICSLDLSL